VGLPTVEGNPSRSAHSLSLVFVLTIASTTSIDQKNDLAARIARAAAVFCVDEIVIFDDAPSTIPQKLRRGKKDNRSKAEVLQDVPEDAEPWDNPDQFLFHLLSFLECPGHLRQYVFPKHPNLRGSGKLPTLDMPHHMRSDEWCQYREGVSMDPESPGTPLNLTKSRKPEGYTLVNCGLGHPVLVPAEIQPWSRVTLKFDSVKEPPSWPDLSADEIANLKVEPVEPSLPRVEGGYYWGFNVRKAESLSAVLTECEFENGYDISIGTSERGVPLSDIMPESLGPSKTTPKLPPKFKHLILFFGGVTGLEPAVESDPIYRETGLTKETAHETFDFWVNLVPGQGSRTIRTEEAVWLGLMGTRGYVESNY
jgi:predicted SPOUT superfamily RNA methylase MTH1